MPAPSVQRLLWDFWPVSSAECPQLIRPAAIGRYLHRALWSARQHDGYNIDEVRQKSDPHIDRCWSIIVTPCRTEERCFAYEAKLTPHSTRFSKKMSAPSVISQFLKKTLQGAASVILAANTQSSLATLSIRSLALGEILCDR